MRSRTYNSNPYNARRQGINIQPKDLSTKGAILLALASISGMGKLFVKLIFIQLVLTRYTLESVSFLSPQCA